MVVNAFRSQSQLSANPCSVVARDTRTPMAATLRAGAPASFRHPHPGPAVDPAGFQAHVGAYLDQRFLEAPNVIDHIQRFGQPDDRVADQLPRPVPGDLAAAVGVDRPECPGRAARAARCAGRRYRRAGVPAAAGCRDRRRPGRRPGRAAVARRRGSRPSPAGGRRSRSTATGWSSWSRGYPGCTSALGRSPAPSNQCTFSCGYPPPRERYRPPVSSY